MLQTMTYREKKNREEMNDAVLRLETQQPFEPYERSQFIELGSQTAVHTDPYFFCMERFFTLNGP